jgi:hypothetical protein
MHPYAQVAVAFRCRCKIPVKPALLTSSGSFWPAGGLAPGRGGACRQDQCKCTDVLIPLHSERSCLHAFSICPFVSVCCLLQYSVRWHIGGQSVQTTKHRDGEWGPYRAGPPSFPPLPKTHPPTHRARARRRRRARVRTTQARAQAGQQHAHAATTRGFIAPGCTRRSRGLALHSRQRLLRHTRKLHERLDLQRTHK